MFRDIEPAAAEESSEVSMSSSLPPARGWRSVSDIAAPAPAPAAMAAFSPGWVKDVMVVVQGQLDWGALDAALAVAVHSTESMGRVHLAPPPPPQLYSFTPFCS